MGIRVLTGPVLLFELEGGASGPALFGLSASEVSQVLELERYTPVPLAPGPVIGITNHAGRIITVVDPAPLLGFEAQPGPLGFAVLVRREAAVVQQVALKILRTAGIADGQALQDAGIEPGFGIRWVAKRGRDLVHIVSSAALMGELARRFDDVGSGTQASPGAEGANP